MLTTKTDCQVCYDLKVVNDETNPGQTIPCPGCQAEDRSVVRVERNRQPITDEAELTAKMDRYVVVGDNYVRLSKRTPFPVWLGTTEKTYKRMDNWGWALADLYNFGEDTYGEDASQAFDHQKVTKRHLQNCGVVGRAFPVKRRRKALSFRHHTEVMGLDIDNQEAVLDAAEAEGWSSARVAQEVKRIKLDLDGPPALPSATKKIYLASSWRNPHYESVLAMLQGADHEVFDFKHPNPDSNGFHWSEIDPDYQGWTWEQYQTALVSTIPAGTGYLNNYSAMQWADVGILLLPSGRSAHLEAGYFKGAGKPLYIILAGEVVPELMYRLADELFILDQGLDPLLIRLGQKR